MGLFVKICGICSEGDLGQISALGPDALGFIQWPKSKRYIDPKAVGRWETPEGMKRVGVFVCPTESELAHAAQYGRFDVLQVHRVPDHWKMDRDLFQGLEIWRALNPDELYHAESWFEFDRFLLDSYDSRTVGGTGKTCDWGKAKTLVKSVEKPILLAGGLSPENVEAAVAEVKPWGVDVSSGVETEPGVKDMAKVEAFIAACRKK
ncbi:phosphoribosylanthranilate isomerase [Pontiella sulfatireligans]|uniref:N-(5'-phosphoribosyl)anthranilate isomerase n=1 Tax=Pontiella sulfatireligans TaxID=2750658 RepID=A0A6C2UMX6_9BACT|nr:phosphoribosylanthranilate isomerase [Pontiella sulfatireligans]VGO21508.1 N-(5'-phosphoribosyl)anthranilate isomerase [Pontiella sulfatireligans]